jgi:hypothetical protein
MHVGWSGLCGPTIFYVALEAFLGHMQLHHVNTCGCCAGSRSDGGFYVAHMGYLRRVAHGLVECVARAGWRGCCQVRRGAE